MLPSYPKPQLQPQSSPSLCLPPPAPETLRLQQYKNWCKIIQIDWSFPSSAKAARSYHKNDSWPDSHCGNLTPQQCSSTSSRTYCTIIWVLGPPQGSKVICWCWGWERWCIVPWVVLACGLNRGRWYFRSRCWVLSNFDRRYRLTEPNVYLIRCSKSPSWLIRSSPISCTVNSTSWYSFRPFLQQSAST